jgi:hypothetical protein
MQNDPYKARKSLTFAQAEGAEPLPQQLALKTVSDQLRSMLWFVVHNSMSKQRRYIQYGSGRSRLDGSWAEVLEREHVLRGHQMADEFRNDFDQLVSNLKRVFEHGDYVDIFDLTQWLLRQPEKPIAPEAIRHALKTSRAAYRLLNDNLTIVPITSDQDADTLQAALVDTSSSEFGGARAHLLAAARELTAGSPAASIRESIHAVESAARVIAGKSSLSGALQVLKNKGHVHGALEKGFGNLYGFTSDEKGIRHPLLENGAAAVDEYDALFMIGACSAFVSYLINRVGQDSA